jgi:lipopolysaccharide transport system permease protein
VRWVHVRHGEDPHAKKSLTEPPSVTQLGALLGAAGSSGENLRTISANDQSKFGPHQALCPASGSGTTGGRKPQTVSVASVTFEAGKPPPSIDLHGEATSPGRLAREVWKARELLVILARKDFQVRYRRASLGILWALALPLLQAVVLAVVFSHVGHFRSVPHTSYTMFILTGMVPWAYFTLALPAGSTAIVDNTDLSSKVYFPRSLLPLGQVLTALYSYFITLAIVLILCPVFGVGLGPRLALVILSTLLMLAITTGFVLVDSALHVYFRDFRYMVTAALLVWLYVTPIIYSAAQAPRTLRTVIDLNPLTGVVDLFRAATVGNVGSIALPVAMTLVWSAVLLVAGAILHCRFNRVFADLL